MVIARFPLELPEHSRFHWAQASRFVAVRQRPAGRSFIAGGPKNRRFPCLFEIGQLLTALPRLPRMRQRQKLAPDALRHRNRSFPCRTTSSLSAPPAPPSARLTAHLPTSRRTSSAKRPLWKPSSGPVSKARGSAKSSWVRSSPPPKARTRRGRPRSGLAFRSRVRLGASTCCAAQACARSRSATRRSRTATARSSSPAARSR